MRRHLLYIGSILLLMLFTACANESDQRSDKGATLRISVSTNAMTTRTTPNLSEVAYMLPSGARIGVTAQKTDGTVYGLSSAITTNIPYIANGTGNQQTWSSTTPITLTLQQAQVSAYYPYGSGLDPAAIPITCSNSSPDWMYAVWQTESTGESYISELYRDVALTLRHAQAVLAVRLTSNGYTGAGRVSRIVVNGTFGRSGTLNSYTGELTGVTKTTITENYASPAASFSDPGYWTDRWFVMPIDVDRPQLMTFVLNVDGAEYRTISSATFEQGKIYTFNLSLNPVQLDVTGIDIVDWTEISMTSGGLTYTDAYEESEYKYSEGSGGSGMEVAPEGILMCSDDNYDYYWASCNLHATTTNPMGTLYRYGEVDGVAWMDVSDRDISGTEYDAATVLWGNGWHTPTEAEWDMLKSGCDWEMDEDNDVVTATSKATGLVITFPVQYTDNVCYYSVGNRYFWNDSYEYQTFGFMYFSWNGELNLSFWADEVGGIPVRAVRKVEKE